MNTIKKHLLKCIELNNLGFELQISDYYEDGMSFDDLMEALNDAIIYEEIIYYYKAMEYLSEHDNSLTESMEMAFDLGYQTDSINSELLATLLHQHKLHIALYELETEIETILNK